MLFHSKSIVCTENRQMQPKTLPYQFPGRVTCKVVKGFGSQLLNLCSVVHLSFIPSSRILIRFRHDKMFFFEVVGINGKFLFTKQYLQLCDHVISFDSCKNVFFTCNLFNLYINKFSRTCVVWLSW